MQYVLEDQAKMWKYVQHKSDIVYTLYGMSDKCLTCVHIFAPPRMETL